MSIKALVLLPTLLSLIGCSLFNLEKNLSKSNHKRPNINISPKDLRYLQESQSNYIILYFNRGCYYPKGFANTYRKDINYIINLENNNTFGSNEAFTINSNCSIVILFSKSVENLNYFFSGNIDENMIYLQNIDFYEFDTSLVTDMSYMFAGCSSLENLYLADFDTSKVVTMGNMFDGCRSLTYINFDNWATPSLCYMANMFTNCNSLLDIDISNFDLSSVSNMDQMFYECYSLTSINMSNYGTPELFTVVEIFFGCDSLNILDLSNLDISHCDYYSNMFSNISNLIYINLYNFIDNGYMYSIFQELNHDLYVCQGTDIISNSWIISCCDYDSYYNICYDIEQIDYDEPYTEIPPYHLTDEYNGANEDEFETSISNNKSSNKISTGIIIAIIAGIIVFIAIIAIIVFCICKKKCGRAKDPPTDTAIKINRPDEDTIKVMSNITQIKDANEEKIYEYITENDCEKGNKIKVTFMNTAGSKVIILINPNRTTEELIKYFFKIIQRPSLYKEENICLLINGGNIDRKSKNEIKSLFQLSDEKKELTIIVNDSDEKLKGTILD